MKNKEMNKLADEAAVVTQELGDIVFIGAVAVYLHTKSGRQSRDLDFAVASEITDEQLFEKGYKKDNDNTYTPRGYKIDIYTRDVSGISIHDVVNTAKIIERRKKNIKIAALEILIIAKHRANRSQDLEDLKEISTLKFREIDWNSLKSLTNSDVEYERIKQTVDTYRKINF